MPARLAAAARRGKRAVRPGLFAAQQEGTKRPPMRPAQHTPPTGPAGAATGGTGPETPSGKGAADENFPVGSALLPAHLRPHVAAYYAFARAIDDIADNGALSAAEKITRLKAFDAALKGEAAPAPGFEKAHRLRASLLETGVSADRGSDLVAAFVQDAVKLRYRTWDELLGYCRLSANPVGQYLLDLHGEDPAAYRYSDALCTVLQIVNHLQDCGDDRRELDRVYIIGEWMDEAGARLSDLDATALTPGLRRVIDRMLDGCDALMVDARRLPSMLKSRRLAMESAVIVNLAARLIQRLRKGDPLAARVALSKLDFAQAGLIGAASGFFAAGRGA
jgi:squalene synthase HpnC